MSYREKAPEVRSIANFNVPEIAFQKSAKGTLYFHEESPGIGAASVFWLIPVSKQSQSKAFQALGSVEMLYQEEMEKAKRKFYNILNIWVLRLEMTANNYTRAYIFAVPSRW